MTFIPPEAPFDAEQIVRTLAKVARHKRDDADATLLESASAQAVWDSHDNWNGGTDFYNIILSVPPARYAEVEGDLQDVEQKLLARMQPLTRGYPGYAILAVLIQPDATLVEPVAFPNNGQSAEDGPEIWTPGRFRLFISHVTRVKAEAHKLKVALADHCVSAFVAHDDITPSLPWQSEIERALHSMDALVAVVTPDFIESRWCDQEVGFALGAGKLVVPVRVGADPYGFIGKDQGIQGKGISFGNIATAVVRALLVNPKTQSRLLDILVTRLEIAGSYNAAKATMTELELAPVVPEAFLVRIEAALANNSEVYDAFGVPNRVKNLCAQQRARRQVP